MAGLCKAKAMVERKRSATSIQIRLHLGAPNAQFQLVFMIMFPIAVTMSFNISWFFLVYFLLNVFVHALVDDLKANRKKINLWHDQLIHMVQIAVTAAVMLF